MERLMADDDLVLMFGQRMTLDRAEALGAAQLVTSFSDADGEYPRILFGNESFLPSSIADSGPCRHCRTIKGKLHVEVCDYEQCPKCGEQQMSCDCEFIGYEWRDEPV
jgi:hypothetical protein